eukprot:NODE_1_length_95616_cov_0.657642.p51 type:complete len:219 gc:universal NODE_1_length_95616_cov_0.657642:83291-83947(+)
MKRFISPSILSSDFSRLYEECSLCLDKSKYIHLDVMDNHFVPNLTFGPPIIKCLKKRLEQQTKPYFLDCHLMVTNPESIIPLLEGHADSITFHCEVSTDTLSLIELCRKHGLKASMAIKPETQLSTDLISLCKYLDSVLIMTVNPGFGGQSMIMECLDKVKKLRAEYPELDIQVDGGINVKTISMASKSGANNFVAGSAIFKHEKGIHYAIDELNKLI